MMDSNSLRLVVVSTPRSGNTWLRKMLAKVLDLSELAVHAPHDVPWQSLPERFILQIHWLPDASFLALLAEHGFRPIVLARHPLDVLLSILVFAQHDESTLYWLGGSEEERSLVGAGPLSETLLRYAISDRATALLNVSAAWWRTGNAFRVRYEDLVTDGAGQIEKILSWLGVTARVPPAAVVESTSVDSMRKLQVEFLFHIWQGQPGLWKRLLTGAAARQICDVHHAVLNLYGYACDADDSLDLAAAHANWERMETAALKRNVAGLKRILAIENAQRHQERNDREQMRGELQSLANDNHSLTSQVVALATTVAPLEARIGPIEAQIAPLAAQIAPLASQIEPLTAQLQQLAAQVNPLTAQVDRLAIEVEPIGAQLQQVATQISPLAAQIQPLSEHVLRLESQIAPLTAQIRPLAAQIHPLAVQVQQLSELSAMLCEAKAQSERDLQSHKAELESLVRQFADLPVRQIRELAGLGPWSVGAARSLQGWSRRFPRVTKVVKSMASFARSTKVRLRNAVSNR